ncbi:MAG: DUF58 domain-containing protein [Thermoguttaceae bacterium]|nr:DUF58 domain-containing protein [Thermoguttaceae bacterium]
MSAFFFEYWGYWAFPAAIALPAASAFFFRTYPTRRALAALAIPGALSIVFFVLAAVEGSGWTSGRGLGASVVAALDGLAAAILAFDWAMVAFVGRGLTAIRTAEPTASVGTALDVELALENRSKRAISAEIVDDSNPNAVALAPRSETDALLELDADAEPLPDGARFERRTIGAGQKETLRYRLRWNRRGEFTFEFVALRLVGALGCWNKYCRLPCETTFRVYPNLRRLASFETLGRAGATTLLGLRRTRTVGQNDEFERLRDFEEGDQYKFIDWKATAKRNKLTTRVFQTSKNQRIILAIDAGRTTANRASGVSFFDAALNSTLALAYLALKQGDEVGCVVFSNEVKRYVAPRGGMAQTNALIGALYDVFPERVEARYDRAFAYLASKTSKRALVVLATNIADERNAARIEQVATSLTGKHLPLGLFFRDRSLFDAVERFDDWERGDDGERSKLGGGSERTKKDARFDLGWLREFASGSDDEIERFFLREKRPEDATPNELFYRASAAAEILNRRRRALRRLEALGALTLDVFPEDAAAPLINKYLEIKARRLL